jgi:poly(3-hydroxybutyrate) depolymerase
MVALVGAPTRGLAATASARAATSVDQIVTFGPGTPAAGRTYQLHITGSTPRPLVIVLHGYLLTVPQVERQTGFSKYGQGHGFDVAYAVDDNGSGAWNAGGCCGGVHSDDVTYLEQVVDDVRARAQITQAYVVGFSNGGMMALRAICQSTYFAAAASVAGPLLVPCHRKVRALHLQGISDHTVPTRGGYSAFTKTRFPDSLHQTAVLTVRLFKGGHQWPKGATAEIWGFLRGKSR